MIFLFAIDSLRLGCPEIKTTLLIYSSMLKCGLPYRMITENDNDID